MNRANPPTGVTEHGAEAIAWDLSDLYEDRDAALNDLHVSQTEAEAFAQVFHSRVQQLEAAELAEALERLERIHDRLGRVQAYAYLRWSAETSEPERGAFLQKVREISSRISQTLLFFELEWSQSEEARASALLAEPSLARYRHYLEIQLLMKRHQLSEPEEKIMAEKAVTGVAAWSRFFDQILGAARFEWQGEQVSEQQILAKLHEAERAVRRDAALSFSEGILHLLPQLAFIFNTVLAEKASDDRLRRYDHWLAARNLSNEISDETVRALISAVTARYDLVARYYRLKGRLLGIEPLEDFDRYAPLGGAASRYRWDEALRLVVDTYAAFHPECGAIATRFFAEQWVDAGYRPGKRGGAFSHGVVPSAHPFILVNFTGKLRDVQTLAHELGHGIHQYLSREQGVFHASTPLTTAETASVFGEMLVFRRLMDQETGRASQLSMLMGKIDDTMATVFRQVAMNRFEEAIHTARGEEGELSVERFGEFWIQTQEAMFRGSVRLNPYYSNWWSYIPHFIHTPGYVYAYAFGELLVLSLFELYSRQGSEFVDKYLSLLRAGGSDWPERLLASFGVDLKDPAFWSAGLASIESLIEHAEELAQ
jgi:oligoendopeptidase F